MERDSFRIIKSQEELHNVKYIRKKDLKIRFPESNREVILKFSKDSESKTEVYTVLIDGEFASEKNSMYEAVRYISLVIARDIEEEKMITAEQEKIEERLWWARIVKVIVGFVGAVAAFAVAYALVALILK